MFFTPLLIALYIYNAVVKIKTLVLSVLFYCSVCVFFFSPREREFSRCPAVFLYHAAVRAGAQSLACGLGVSLFGIRTRRHGSDGWCETFRVFARQQNTLRLPFFSFPREYILSSHSSGKKNKACGMYTKGSGISFTRDPQQQ